MRDKTLKFKKKHPVLASPERVENLRKMVGGDECKLQFILWAEGTSLEVGGIHHGEPVFRPAICAWEAWKGAWNLLRSNYRIDRDPQSNQPT